MWLCCQIVRLRKRQGHAKIVKLPVGYDMAKGEANENVFFNLVMVLVFCVACQYGESGCYYVSGCENRLFDL